MLGLRDCVSTFVKSVLAHQRTALLAGVFSEPQILRFANRTTRGAILALESESVTQHVTTTLCGCNRVQLRAFRLKVQSRSRPLRRPFCETSRPPSTCCISVTLLFAWPSQKRIKSSGACCFLSHVALTGEMREHPISVAPVVWRSGCKESLKTFDCSSGSPFFERNNKPEARSPMNFLSIAVMDGWRSMSRTPLLVFRNG